MRASLAYALVALIVCIPLSAMEPVQSAPEPSSASSGRVLDPAGNPANDMSVRVSRPGGQAFILETDENGTFDLDGISQGRYTFSVVDKKKNLVALQEVDLATTHQVILKLQEGPHGTIVGDVRGGSTLPAVGLSRGLWSKVVYPDQKGHFHAEHVPTGLVEVQADFPGRMLPAVWATVSADQETTVDLKITPTVTVKGTVRRDGAPVAGMVSFAGAESASGATTPDGSYEVNVAPGEYVIQMTGNSGSAIPIRKHVTIKEPTTLDLSVEGVSVRVTVLDFDTNEPVPGAVVLAWPAKAAVALARLMTSKDGTAMLDVISGEPTRVSVLKEGYGQANADLGPNDRNVTLRIRNRPGAVVQLVDAHDRQVIGGYVLVRDLEGRTVFLSREPDMEGKVALPLVPGEYQISASAEGHGSETVTMSIPGSELRIPLPRGGSLSLHAAKNCDVAARLLQADGEPYVRCWCNGIKSINVDCPDTFVDHISPGSYTLEITYMNGKTKRFPVTLIEGETVSLSID